jgi:hypothetical protein
MSMHVSNPFQLTMADTALFHGDFFSPEDIGGVKPMSVETLAKHAITALKKDKLDHAWTRQASEARQPDCT